MLYIRSYLASNVTATDGAGGSSSKTTMDAPRRQTEKGQSKNPWYGWQPTILGEADRNTCPLQKCLAEKGTFETHPTCHTCMDDPSDLLPVPSTDNNWVPDATMLHQMYLVGKDNNGNPWPPPIHHDYCAPLGVFGGPNDGNKKLFDDVPIRPIKSATRDAGGPTIFCGVYTMEQNHASNIRAMRETWAPHCDGFVAFSTATDPRIPAISIDHEGPEEYNNMWQKSRSIWHFIGQHYLDQFDYFILGGEDLLVIPDNLRAYLKSLNKSPEDDLFAGRRFKGYGPNNYFNSGGAGYVLSKGTLRKYYETGYDHKECSPHRHTAMEDVMIAECLRKVFNIGLVDTRDELGRERFHPFAPGLHLVWEHPKEGKQDWYEDYNKEWGLKTGVDCCAPDSVSFHYIKKPATVRHLWALLYECE